LWYEPCQYLHLRLPLDVTSLTLMCIRTFERIITTAPRAFVKQGDGDGEGLSAKTLLRAPLGSPERYFHVYYVTGVGGRAGHDQYIYEHPNGLFVIGLGEV
jgi:hypothetical protein